jgi:hypothetical protein
MKGAELRDGTENVYLMANHRVLRSVLQHSFKDGKSKGISHLSKAICQLMFE